jgi:3-hydroxybutyryl-CoA dehydratase
MNKYRFKDLSIGIEEKFSIKITDEMLSSFLSITGDCNPLHNDKHFAISKNYQDRVVYGMLTASFISTLAGVYLPGKYCLIHLVECKFLRPVFVGNILTVSGTVVEMYESVQEAEIKILMINQDKEKVLRGKLKVGFLAE